MNRCQYTHPSQGQCTNNKTSENDEGLCFWHENSIKECSNLKSQLEEQAKKTESLAGYQLRKASISGINLVNMGHKEGFKLHDCDLYRADLKEAHLFGCDLSGSSLMKADLRYANLHCANLTGCNLLGTRLEGCRLDNVEWGGRIIQERQAQEAQTTASRLDYWQQAEEIYRNLRKATEQEGLFSTSGYFFEREMVMRRLQMPLLSSQRVFSKIVDLFCGYGERPIRVVLFSVLAVLIFASLYFMLGINDNGNIIALNLEHTLFHNIKHFLTCCYFSVVTFTTLGYGDLTPIGLSRFLAAIEAFIGSFTLALFVVVFVKKMTR